MDTTQEKTPSIKIEALIHEFIVSPNVRAEFMEIWRKQLGAIVGSKQASTYIHGDSVNGGRVLRKVLRNADEIRTMTRETLAEFGIAAELPADFIIEGKPAMTWMDYLKLTDAPQGWSYRDIEGRKKAQTMICKLHGWGYVEPFQIADGTVEGCRYKITRKGRKSLKSGKYPTGKTKETVTTPSGRVKITRRKGAEK